MATWIAVALVACASLGAACAATPLDSSTTGTAEAESAHDAIADHPVETEIKSTQTTSARPVAVDDRPRVWAVDDNEKIRLKPVHNAPIIGLIRMGMGAVLQSEQPVEGLGVSNCKGGWYAVEPRGYVCVGQRSTLYPNDPRVVAAAEVLPDRERDMPYWVGTLADDTPLYQRIPTAQEQRMHEPGLDAHLADPPTDDEAVIDTAAAGTGPSEAFLAYQAFVKKPLVAERKGYEGRQVAWAHEFDAEGRTWLVTPNLTLIPKDKVFLREQPTLRGVDLRQDKDFKLPLAYLWLDPSTKHERNANGDIEPTADTWPRHGFVPIENRLVKGPGGLFYPTRDGRYIAQKDVTVIKERSGRPPGVGEHDKWMHVRITWGFLVAYEGDEPIFATAISPGADGVTPRAGGHNTKIGRYYIGWKLFSADMDGVDNGVPWAVDDVPYVAYYKDSYALHGAWWHDDFGRPKSHGCVNIAPADARWLWEWMDPAMPEGWFAVTAYYPDVAGTLVDVRP